MKTDRAALLWGMVIAVGFITVTMVLVFRFPNFRLPFIARYGEAMVASGIFSFLFVASYRKLWKRFGFWALLIAFGVANWLIAVYIAGAFGGLRMDVLYGVVGGGEFAVFALIMAWLYHQGPEVPSWMGLRSR
ncbi:MAG: hypothetical protein ACRD4X_01080 [Candidatus Acidiferrales bacterium]